MRAGELRERVIIQTNTTAADAAGVYTGAWSTLDTVWAKVEATSGSQTGEEMAQGETLYTITIRYRTDVTREKRITWGSKVMDILTVLPDPKKTQLVIEAKETT